MKTTIEDILTIALMTPMGDPVRDPANCKMGLPTILWGTPGIGKSFRIEHVSMTLGLPCEIILPSTRQPEDASGAAMPDGSGGVIFVSLLPGVKRLKQNKQGVLVLDELSCAKPSVQAAFLGVILDRRVGDEKLPPGIRILAAANDAEEAAGGWELEPPMANRLCHIDVPPPTDDDWVAWLMKDEAPVISPLESAEMQLAAGWDSAWAWARSMRAGYGKVNRDDKVLLDIPAVGKPERGKGWPSPRSWTMALRAMATCKIFGKAEDVMHTFVCGCIGSGIGTEFITWMRNADLPTAEEALKNGWKPDTQRLDRSVAVYSSVGLHMAQLEKTNRDSAVRLAPKAWKLLHEGWEAGLGDIVIVPAHQLINANLGRTSSQEAKKIASPLLEQMANSGYHKILRKVA